MSSTSECESNALDVLHDTARRCFATSEKGLLTKLQRTAFEDAFSRVTSMVNLEDLGEVCSDEFALRSYLDSDDETASLFAKNPEEYAEEFIKAVKFVVLAMEAIMSVNPSLPQQGSLNARMEDCIAFLKMMWMYDSIGQLAVDVIRQIKASEGEDKGEGVDSMTAKSSGLRWSILNGYLEGCFSALGFDGTGLINQYEAVGEDAFRELVAEGFRS